MAGQDSNLALCRSEPQRELSIKAEARRSCVVRSCELACEAKATGEEQTMHARAGRVSFSPDKADEVINSVRDSVLPRIQQSEGFKGFTLLVDRSRGEGIGISFWESEDAMRATDDLGDQARQSAAEAGSGSDQGAERFEVAIDTMA
jgi:heme-degrading monooxygenase HmoA